MNALKTVVTTALAVGALSLLSGCAGMADNTRLAQARTYQPSPTDMAYVNAVNRAAKYRGVHVHWINPPTVRGD